MGTGLDHLFAAYAPPAQNNVGPERFTAASNPWQQIGAPAVAAAQAAQVAPAAMAPSVAATGGASVPFRQGKLEPAPTWNPGSLNAPGSAGGSGSTDTSWTNIPQKDWAPIAPGAPVLTGAKDYGIDSPNGLVPPPVAASTSTSAGSASVPTGLAPSLDRDVATVRGSKATPKAANAKRQIAPL